MARKLDKFPERSTSKWEQFLDGNIWELKRGEDFESGETPQLIRARITSAAVVRGFHLKTRLVDDQTLVIQSIPRSS